MNTAYRLLSSKRARGLAAACTAIGALALVTPTGEDLDDRALALPAHRNICEQTSIALRTASMKQVDGDYFEGLAKCLNDEDADLWDCLRNLRDERREARALVRAQYRARRHVCRLVGPGAYDPDIDPDDFSTNITNRYLPYTPGRTLIYEKTEDGETERIVVKRLDETVEIAGIECIVVSDIVTLDGEPIEETLDWYAQDDDGNVWYIGEIAKNFEDGLLDNLDGSWMTGKDGAKPGIVMLANPCPGTTYRQEYLVNEAEDVATVVSTGNTVTVRAGRFTDCIETEDFTPIEPGVVERKFYAPGIGFVLEIKPASGERLELVEIIDR